MRKREKVRVLRRAREILERPYGWTKGAFVRRTRVPQEYESYCLLGSLNKAAQELGVKQYNIESTRIAREISLWDHITSKGYGSVAEFNDAKGRKKTEVLGVIDEYLLELGAKP